MHGYYYFRPYHHSHIAAHQAVVAGWGGDPRNPYSNAIYRAVYAASGQGQDAPLPIPPVVSPR
jgi:hypothetical protein